jgi:hypothetical protein
MEWEAAVCFTTCHAISHVSEKGIIGYNKQSHNENVMKFPSF